MKNDLLLSAILLTSLLYLSPGSAQPTSQQQFHSTSLSASQIFDLAEKMQASGALVVAEKAYQALIEDTNVEIRVEARFRYGMMLADRLHRPRDAAVQFRRILDEKPDAARVRLELARMNAILGDLGSARRELRAAQASGLPADVERLVRFYANALNVRKPIGGSVEVAFAPDTNINRATRSDTLGTVIGDFTLGRRPIKGIPKGEAL